ncbi:MAG: hypothetical protein J6J36_03025 [Clostridia bacterium]|nr:hypothetical protein [Clostridia bacterium]
MTKALNHFCALKHDKDSGDIIERMYVYELIRRIISSQENLDEKIAKMIADNTENSESIEVYEEVEKFVDVLIEEYDYKYNYYQYVEYCINNYTRLTECENEIDLYDFMTHDFIKE